MKTARFLFNVLVSIALVGGLCLSPRQAASAAPAASAAAPVEILFVMDTSASMDDDFSALCSNITGIVNEMKAQNITITYRILGISATRMCATGTVRNTIEGSTVNHEEDWGPAVRDLSGAYAWKPGATRLIIPMTDEGPENGNTCNSPGDDENIIIAAIAAAKTNKVRVSVVLGTGSDSCTTSLAQRLASGTGGQVFNSKSPAKELAGALIKLLGDVINDRDGDGIADSQDPAPDDPCKPNPQAVCLPPQACGISNTPRWDDDKDGKTDEELPNKVDDDKDGLVDEDVGGPNCPFPKQDCGINNHRNFDDDGDGKIDEEIDNNLDDDRDSYIDEDVKCSCPAAQDLGKNETPGVDDDHDFAVDEEADNNRDDDGDGCIDEDIGKKTLPASLVLSTNPITIQPGKPFSFNLTLQDANPALTTNQTVRLTLTNPSKQAIPFEGKTDASGKWSIPANFTLHQTGTYLYGGTIEGLGKVEYPVVVPGEAQPVDYEQIFLTAAKNGGLDPKSIQVYTLPTTIPHNMGEINTGALSYQPSLNMNLLQPSAATTLPEEARLRMYYYQYKYPGDTTYVPPDPEKLKRAEALVKEDERKALEQFLNTVDEGLTIVVYAKEAFVCTVGVIGTAATIGVAACAPLVIHLSSDAVKALAKREYEAGRMDKQTYNALTGVTTITAAGAMYLVAPEKSAWDSVRFTAQFLQGTSEITMGTDANAHQYVRAGSTAVEIGYVANEASSLSSTLMVTLRSPVRLVVTDPRGRKAYFDPATYAVRSEIPGISFPLPGMEPQRVRIPNPVSGDYQFALEGTGNGAYTFEVATANRGGKFSVKTFKGNVMRGDKIDYKTSVKVGSQGKIEQAQTSGPGASAMPDWALPAGLAGLGCLGLLGAAAVVAGVYFWQKRRRP